MKLSIALIYQIKIFLVFYYWSCILMLQLYTLYLSFFGLIKLIQYSVGRQNKGLKVIKKGWLMLWALRVYNREGSRILPMTTSPR